MNKRVKISAPKRVIIIDDENDERETPFWLEHILGIIGWGVAVIVLGMVLLALTDWGRATLVWIGLGFGLATAVWLAIEPWRSIRSGAPAAVWGGQLLTAIGWGGVAISLAAGIPLMFWLGPRNLPEWTLGLPGAGSIAFTAVAVLGMRMQTRRPLPALDRTARSAQVLFIADDSEGGQSIRVRYVGADGEKHDAELADVIDDSWTDRFTPGSTWQIYAFTDPALAESVVFLTERHDEVWRSGYKLDGVRLGGESGPVHPVGPGSPFFREDGKWTFES